MTAVTAYLGLGSSLGDRTSHLRDALRRLETAEPRLRVTALSPVYQTPHFGLKPGDETRYPPHLNLVARIETELSPTDLLHRIHAVEAAGGRQRTERWGPRTIDIDILLYAETEVRTPALTLPHPGIAERAFVAVPLADLAPALRLPDGRSLAEVRASAALRSQSIERVYDELPV
jgi:2-amino-4-hydroxy-6-hydroxymethyldihydropteridine diphosphokinase